MWSRAVELIDEVDRLHRQFFEPLAASGVPRWEPPVDVIETDAEHWILVALPGVNPQRVRVFLEGPVLVVEGERAMPAKAIPGAIRRLEIPYGRFERRIRIPSGQFEVNEQSFENGCLVIGLRRLA
ncbi:MAG: heat-shock protein Hsp20 [Proteobacteria bacterium]|nr:MAG: heat-shock protein Hsp20 [Pseudomonadota bacterium]